MEISSFNSTIDAQSSFFVIGSISPPVRRSRRSRILLPVVEIVIMDPAPDPYYFINDLKKFYTVEKSHGCINPRKKVR
jgi:hypothetical protein